MPDGRQNYDTKEVERFAGINAQNDPSKAEFPETDSPYMKNCLNLDGILSARQGRARINATRFTNEITSMVSYTDRSGVEHLVFSVKTTTSDPVAPDGTIQETH